MARALQPSYLYPQRLTKAGAAIAARLEKAGRPIITPYDFFREVVVFFASPDSVGIRKSDSLIEAYQRIRRSLSKAKIIVPDDDYGSRADRVQKVSDLPADDICCIVDPFCYISHMSAMERYGLTNRRPKALQLSRPEAKILRVLAADKMQQQLQDLLPKGSPRVALRIVTHPTKVRQRPVSVFQTAHAGHFVQVRDSFARIAKIGQTFLDMLDEPALCGGLSHVLAVWRNHAQTYLEEIVEAVEASTRPILKVRAGYILDEELKIADARVDSWRRFCQRGGSRLLDPTKPYAPSYSEKWMISINV